MTAALSAFAPAKINLCLHVTGRRVDGYHLLDSLAVFAGAGDTLTATPAEGLTLTIDGPFAGALAVDSDNLVLRAARALATAAGWAGGARLQLTKRLPVASGIGGGSADAAAALRLLSALWRLPAEIRADLPAIAVGLGADVPVCLASAPARMHGIGERLDPVALPAFGLVLVNPGVGVPTAAVFHALRDRGAGWSAPLEIARWTELDGFVEWLGSTRNDLQAPAIALCPQIADVLTALMATQGCRLARMSGSGATCFGIYATAAEARAAAASLEPGAWWRWGGERPGAVPLA